MHDLAPENLMNESGVDKKNFIQVGVKAINDLDKKKIDGKVTEDYGRSPIWNVFGGWKPPRP
jgi:hypothetical protein